MLHKLVRFAVLATVLVSVMARFDGITAQTSSRHLQQLSTAQLMDGYASSASMANPYVEQTRHLVETAVTGICFGDIDTQMMLLRTFYGDGNKCAEDLFDKFFLNPLDWKNTGVNLVEALVKSSSSTPTQQTACAGDLPAVALAMTAAHCPASGVVCDVQTGSDMKCGMQGELGCGREGTAGNLAAAVISDVIGAKGASKRREKAGTALMFAVLRIGLAASQTTSYADCIANLSTYLKAVPAQTATTPKTTLDKPDLSTDAVKLSCYAIGLLSDCKTGTWPASTLLASAVQAAQALEKAAGKDADRNSFYCKLFHAVLTMKDKGQTISLLDANSYGCVLGNGDCKSMPSFLSKKPELPTGIGFSNGFCA